MIQTNLFLVVLLCFTFKIRSEKLSEYISYYEPLTYNNELLHQSHLRAKRSTHNSVVNLNFKAHGRHFNLRLKRDTSAFASDLSVETSSGVSDIDMSHLYSGHLPDEPESSIYGSIRNGVFEGKIHTPDKVFYVERAHKYFVKHPQPFHSVIYSSDDVKDPHAHKRENHLGGCGITEDVLQWMQEVSNSADTKEFTNKEKQTKTVMRDRKERSTGAENTPHYIYTREAQNFLFQKEPLIDKRTCTLYIQTDTFLWKHIRSYEPSESSAREEISSLISQHVKAVNYIYENTDFDGYRGIKFVVQRIKINDTSSCPNIGTEYKRSNPFCSPNIDVSNFLNLNSQFNHDDFCLAYIFTYRDFSGGTLGLAWVASASGASGGICEKYKPYNENVNGRQVQTKRSLNTGVITFVNYNSRVAPKVSELTLAHEIGHNFGSPHDYPLECRPGGSDGNFIMYASATSGDRLNNNKFSPCSIRNISTVLRAVFNGEGKENCFQKGDGAFCGNKIVEAPEETCDCGYDGKECSDKCCYPRDVKPYKLANPNAERCTLRPGAHCSPSQGPCCLPSCNFVKFGDMCRAESECTLSSYCNGRSAICPMSEPKPNKTECNKGTQVCWNGECTGSICQKYDMEECFLTSANGAKPEEMCEVACQSKGQPSTCRSTNKIPSMKNISGLKLQPGSPCNDYQGYCDVFQKCRAVDAEGPLARLKNLLLNQQTLKNIKEWITTYWWAVMLMLVGLAIFMGFFIKCCAVHTPSSNPRKAPALRITDTLRHPADTLRRKRHRPPPQPGIPSGPPPPYPGPQPSAPPASSIPIAGPSRGYGEGRGHYNRRDRLQHGDRSNPYVDDPSYAPAYHGRGTAMEMRVKSHA
ncbi:disintegrin and metalloproteinase domain-containing protein 10 isoform X2 [Centruroides vittatus]|uniref:disintegrin and metalloproteinase domain-containing protein 10 isoform X2 n=1 Tax=Centruroides vittatus TaxID=120091 RepID=UPI00350F1542